MAVLDEEKKGNVNLEDVFDESSITGSDAEAGGRKFRRRVKVVLKCSLCESGVKDVTYKDVYQLKKFTSVRGKIIAREKSGACAKHQRQLAKAIKRARFVGLLPYVDINA